MEELYLELEDKEWKFEYTDHERSIARAIVYDDSGMLYFTKGSRDDGFGKATWIETSGGGVEEGEDLMTAVKRELREELGAEVEVTAKIGTVKDYYNLIHRRNVNNYFLCRAKSFGERELTQDEEKKFGLRMIRLTYEEAVREYEMCSDTRIGRLMAARELPVLHRAKEMLDMISSR